MTEQGSGHSVFDELAAGHALHALEPADEQVFLQHAADCPRCSRSMIEFREVAAVLAETAPQAQPGAALGERILAAALAGQGQDRAADPRAGTGGANTRPRGAPGEHGHDTAAGPADAPGPGVVPLRTRRAGRWRRPAAIAAAAALIAGGGIWAGLAATAGGPRAPLATCAQPHRCSEVTLVGAQTHQVAGKVVVLDGEVWMVPTDMTANNPTDQIYVLWQITGAHTPLPVGSFDVKTGVHAPIKIGSLAAPYSGTSAFAVSLQHGRTIPAAPSRPVALGQVS
jgi:hypothetical protein